ncbi:MAG: hypothetical protein KAH01_01745, partial [Caldisericia bacterium]|nr:hypothetical protein [Caldisericia bacterium]
MLRKYFSLLLSLCLALTVFTVEASSVNAMSLRSNALAMPALTLEQANNALSSSSSFFTENKGQWTEEILFIGNTDFGKVAFTNEAIYYQLIKDETVASQSIQQTQTIKLSFVDAESPTV